MKDEQFKGWLEKVTKVPILDVSKAHFWAYGFARVAPENAKQFNLDVHGVVCKKNEVKVSAATRSEKSMKREQRIREEATGERPAKRAREEKKEKDDKPKEPSPVTLRALREKKHDRAAKMSMSAKCTPLAEYSYEEQLRLKHDFVKSATRSIKKELWKKCTSDGVEPPAWVDTGRRDVGLDLDEVIPSPEYARTGYRNKCELTIGHDDETGKVAVGFVASVKESQPGVGPIQDLLHVPNCMKEFATHFQGTVAKCEEKYPICKRRALEGVWRVVMLRQAPEGLMAMLQVREIPDDDFVPMWGKEELELTLCGLKFLVSPLSFFQANQPACEVLYQQAIDWLELNKEKSSTMLDVCCGVGTIGLVASKQAKKVLGLEIIAEAVECAKRNAELNDIKNVSFHVGPAEHTLPSLLHFVGAEDEDGNEPEVCALVDPPRAGLHSTVLTAMRNCRQIKKLVYISCNPDSCAKDVAALCHPGSDALDPFVPRRAVAVDMFPHTLHVEMITMLERVPRDQQRKEADARMAEKREIWLAKKAAGEATPFDTLRSGSM